MSSTAPAGDRRPRLMILCDRYPDDLASGRYLRMHHICRELARHCSCFLVDFAGEDSGSSETEPALEIEDRRSLPGHRGLDRSPLRHLRWSNARLLQRVWPTYYEETLRTLAGLAGAWRVDGVVALSSLHGELAVGLGLPRILDWADSNTLTRRRMLEHRGHEFTWLRRQQFRVGTYRQTLRERYLLRNFDVTMTIADADRTELLRVSGLAPERVVLLPNGVSEAALRAGEGHFARERSVAFWGNLDFPPNWTAVEFFNREVFLPYLAPAGVAWSIYGRNAGPQILRIADHPLVTLHGYCPDLFIEARKHSVMVNPMVEGSGLKNKVLEAFGMRLPVVSTARGVEALPVADGRECRIVDDARGFADAVLALVDDPDQASALVDAARRLVEDRFTWQAVGDDLATVVDQVVARTAAAASRTTAP